MRCDKCEKEAPWFAPMLDGEIQRLEQWPFDWCPWCAEDFRNKFKALVSSQIGRIRR